MVVDISVFKRLTYNEHNNLPYTMIEMNLQSQHIANLKRKKMSGKYSNQAKLQSRCLAS